MITIISTLLGLLAGILPTLIKVFEKRMEYKYELLLLQLKTEAAIKGLELSTVIAEGKDLVIEGSDLRKHDTHLDGGKYIESLRASVRPVLTYAFFILFCVVKLLVCIVMINQGINSKEILEAIWDSHTTSLFSTILAFWFGARAMTKFEEIQANKPISQTTIKRSK